MNATQKVIALVIFLAALALIATSCGPQVVEKPVPVEVTRQVEVTRVVEKLVEKQVTALPPPTVEVLSPAETAARNLPTSFHTTTAGMGYWYAQENGGLEQFTHIPYDQLSCKNCHVESCTSCHVGTSAAAPPQAKCVACHGRQAFEINAKNAEGQPLIADVHRAKGMQCVNCHTAEEAHGDGKAYNSLLETAGVECQDCHPQDKLSANPAHAQHSDDMTCQGCHVQTVVTCYNCHFDTEVAAHKKVPYKQVTGWKLLVKRDGKIDVANMMSLVCTQNCDGRPTSFVALAPYFGHSIVKPTDLNALCAQCHDNPNVKEYLEKGTITVSQWDATAKALKFAQGVVPVPADFEKAFQMDFVDIVGQTEEGKPIWDFMKSGVDKFQMLYAEPLDRLPPQMKFNFPTPVPTPSQ
jgi:hypothetical protein